MTREKKRLNCTEVELALASYFDFSRNLIIPNVHWGFNIHECDLLVVTKTGCLYEVEIKVTASDLRKDAKKFHNHHDKLNRIKYLYFAIPDYLVKYIDYIPERAGVLTVSDSGKKFVKLIRKPVDSKSSYRASIEDRYKLARLGALRIWGLKRKTLRKKS